MRSFITLGILAGALLCALATPGQELDQRTLSKEQQQMIDSAHRAYEASAASWEAVNGATVEGVYTWSRRWADAEADGAPKGEQVKACMAHRDRMKKALVTVGKLHDAGEVGGEKDKWEAARYYVAEADYLLLKKAQDNKRSPCVSASRSATADPRTPNTLPGRAHLSRSILPARLEL